MIDEPTLYGAMAAVYALVAAGMVLYARRKSAAVRTVSYLVVGVVAVSAIGAALQAAGVGVYGEGQSVPALVDDVVAYGLLFGLTAWFAGASRRMVLLVAGLSVASRVGIELGTIVGETAVLAALLFSVGTYVVRVYLLWGPVWRTARRQHGARTVLYWKSRNILMFLMGMNIVAVLLLSVGLLGMFGQLITLAYVDFLLRAAFAGFLLANVDALEPDAGDRNYDRGGSAADATRDAPDVA